MTIFIAQIENNKALMGEEESWHCAKVLRKKAGEPVRVIDGKGNFFEGVLESVSERQCTVQLLKGPFVQKARPYYLHLAIAPTKHLDRIEWLVEKLVEIGIDELSFIRCQNSERTVLKIERIQKIIESAVKQSLQSKLPIVNGLTGYSDFLQKHNFPQMYIAHCYEGEKQDIKSIAFKNSKMIFLIGPEGDFSLDEVSKAVSLGYVQLSLGENRLRTETAGLIICEAASLLS